MKRKKQLNRTKKAEKDFYSKWEANRIVCRNVTIKNGRKKSHSDSIFIFVQIQNCKKKTKNARSLWTMDSLSLIPNILQHLSSLSHILNFLQNLSLTP